MWRWMRTRTRNQTRTRNRKLLLKSWLLLVELLSWYSTPVCLKAMVLTIRLQVEEVWRRYWHHGSALNMGELLISYWYHDSVKRT